MTTTLALKHLPDAFPMVVMFLVYAFYLVARFVYFILRRDLYTSGYQDGIYTALNKTAKFKYSTATDVTIAFVQEDEYWKDINGAYRRNVEGETNK